MSPQDLSSQIAASDPPWGVDAAGTLFLVAEAGGGGRLVKRFDHAGWAGPARRARLRQLLRRLARRAHPVLVGCEVPPGDLERPVVVLAGPPARTLAEGEPLPAEEAIALARALIEAIQSAHAERVTGLRFWPERLVWGPQGWRCLAPGLVPGPFEPEQARLEDLAALAEVVAALGPDARLAEAARRLLGPGDGAWQAARQALTALGRPQSGPAPWPAAGPEGLEQPLAELASRLDAVFREGHCEVVWVVDPLETRAEGLLSALAGEAVRAGGLVSWGRCRAHDEPLGPLRPAVRRLLALYGDAELPREWQPLAAVLPELGPVVLPALSPALAKLRLFNAITSLFVSTDAPLAIAFDRADRAEPLTRELIAFMRGQALPVLVVLCGPEPGPEEPAARVRLGLLADDGVERLAAAMCGVPLSPASLERCRLASEGDPALLRRLCQRWLREGLLVQLENGTWHAREGAPEPPPAGAARDVLRALAVLEGEATLPALAAATGLAPEALFDAVEAALDAGWLSERGTSVGFLLPREEAGCVAAMPQAEALRWHRQAGEALAGGPELRRRAHHALLARTPEAAARALEAGESLLAIGSLEQAGAFLEAGLALIGPADGLAPAFARALAALALEREQPEQALARLRPLWEAGTLEMDDRQAVGWLLGRALRAVGSPQEAVAVLEAAAPTAPADQARGWLEGAHAHLDAGEVEAGQQRAEAALALASRLGDEILSIEGHLALGRAMLMGPTEDVPQGLRYLEAVFELAFPAGHLEAACLAYRWLGHAQLSLSQLEPAFASFAEEQALARLLGRRQATVRATLDLAWTALTIGYFEQAEQTLALSEADWEAEAGAWGQAQIIKAIALMMRGYLHDPLRLLDQAQRRARDLADRRLESLAASHLVYALIFLGKYGRAREVCEEAIARAGACEDAEEVLKLRLLLAELAWRQGELETAEETLEAVRLEAAGADMLEAALGLGLSRLAASRGEAAEALRLAERGLTFARSASWVLGQADLLGAVGEAAWALGETEAAGAAYDGMLLAADMMSCPHHRAIALAGLARLTGEAGGASALRARAAENLNIYLEQLSDLGREDFMRLAERRRVLALPGAGRAADGPTGRVPRKAAAEDEEGPRLEDLLGTIHPRLPLEEVTARLAEALMKLSHASRTLVYLLNEEGELKLHQRLEAQDRLSVLGHGEACHWLLQRAVSTGQTLWVSDAPAESEYADLPEVRQQGLRGLLAIPLVAVDAEGERVIGCLYGDSQAAWLGVSERAVRILEHLARYAGVVLEVGLLQEESNRKAHRLEMLNQLSRVIAGTLDLDKLLTLALGQILQITHGEDGYVFFGDSLACRASMDRQGLPLPEVHVSQGVIARVKRDRQPLAILDVGLDSELQSRASLMARNVRSVMCVPLQADDQLVGLIYISSPTANRTFTRNDLDLMTAISAQVALALQNAQSYETIKELNIGLEEKVTARTAELMTAYQELKATQEQLVEKEKLATIGTLAAGVAHEINNPLGAILTNAQLIGLDVDDPEILDSLSLIEEGARRCKEIVSALLRYSKEDRTNHLPVDMQAIVAEALALYEGQLRDARIEVRSALGPVPAILGDMPDLRQMMAHLVRNALDAVPAGRGGVLTVTLAREIEGVVLTVADDGAGMSHEVQRRIFDPFYTTKKVGSGQGLGLSVCQRVVEQHGGTIAVRSVEGEGAVFRIVLPVP